MRFVQPDKTRIELGDGEWIDVKKELTVLEDHQYRTAGMRAVIGKDGKPDIAIDLTEVARARVLAYLLDWSALDGNANKVPITPSSIGALAKEDFEQIDEAIQKHIAASSHEKKVATITPLSAKAS